MCDIRRSRSASHSHQRNEDAFDDDIGFGSRLIEFVVTKDRVFHVHEKLIRSRWSFLYDAFTKAPEKDQRHRSIYLEDEEPTCLNAYLHWLYTGSFRSQLRAENIRYPFFAKLYVFGERHQEREFQDEVSNEIVYDYRRAVDSGRPTCPTEPGIVGHIFTKTPKDSPIRKLVVDMAVVYGQVAWFTDNVSRYPLEYLEEVVKTFVACAADQGLRQNIKQKLETGEPFSYHHVGRRRSQSTSGLHRPVMTENKSRRSSAVPETSGRGINLTVPVV